MEIGIIGLPQTGKKTLFQLLTAQKDTSSSMIQKKGFELGESMVKDPRFDVLVHMYQPQRAVPAKIQYLLLSALQKDSQKNRALFDALEKVDVICHVVRCFKSDSVFHVEGSVDPLRDIRTVNAELLLADIMLVEKRKERLEKELKAKKDFLKEKEYVLFQKMNEVLNKEQFLNSVSFSEEEKKLLVNYSLLTLKQQIVVLNIDDGAVADMSLLHTLKGQFQGLGIYFVQVCAKCEQELAQIESLQERKEFLEAMGIKESAIDQLTRTSYDALGLMSFFTVGSDEVRMWSIPKKSFAPQAARAIHTDLERGFIRAEVIKYEDLVRLGGEEAVKQAGLLLVKGKDYIVEDGDILNIRFSV